MRKYISGNCSVFFTVTDSLENYSNLGITVIHKKQNHLLFLDYDCLIRSEGNLFAYFSIVVVGNQNLSVCEFFRKFYFAGIFTEVAIYDEFFHLRVYGCKRKYLYRHQESDHRYRKRSDHFRDEV